VAGAASVPSFLRRPITGVGPGEAPAERSGRHAAVPERKTVSSDMVLDTVPMGPVKASGAVVHTLLETTATGLRKFDLGNVPASVTPPSSWRRAAWFAVGTSAAVVLGLAVAAVEFMGRPVDDNMIVDALPAYPTRPLTLDELPHQKTTTEPSSRARPSTASSADTPTASQPRLAASTDDPVRNTVAGSSTTDTETSSEPPSQGTSSTTPKEPVRRTVGAAPVTPTDPQAMGDRTEDFFALVTSDPTGAHAMTTGGLAREGAEGIEARYAGVRRIEVQDITIDRNQAVTTSTIKIIREDGTEIVERRQLTFTWGGDPKITDEMVTG
jgi:hypothetical protein